MPNWKDVPENRLREFVQYLDRTLPGTALAFFSTTEREFVEAVDTVLEMAIRTLEANAGSHSGLGELAISTMLSDLISKAGIPCEKESYHNGHVDVTIRHPQISRFQYLGECKIYAGFRRHCDGCDQLLNRYSSGRDLRGFLLEFFMRPGMYRLLKQLKDKFDLNSPLGMNGRPQEHRQIKGGFISIHSHFTKANVEVLHIGCNLYHPTGEMTRIDKRK